MQIGTTLAGMMFALGLLTQAVAADGGVTVKMANHLVITDADGKESLAEGTRAKPGDVLEYEANYRNGGVKPVRNLLATLPVPAGGVEYIARTAAPNGVLASIDGIHFETPPLRRTVTLPDGKQAVREIPVGEYRFLRWNLGELQPGASQSVRARMRIVSTTKTEGTKEAK